MAAWEDDWQRGDVLGDYQLVARLGEGGLSRVYEARHTMLGTRVAIKTLRPEFRQNAAVRARFEREGRATARVSHPHVVRVITLGKHRDAPYLVMEFLSGEDLEQRIKSRGAMALDDALRLMLPVLSAVQAAHDEGLVHRDLKPANIMIEASSDGRDRPVVVDFGIARVSDAPHDHVHTRGSALLGTPAYMSPEQTRGAREVTSQSDLYALGVITLECLTGVLTFDGASMLVLLTRIATGEYTPLHMHRPELPAELEAVIARAMALDPAQRFATVRDFALALLPFADAVTHAHWSPSFTTVRARPARDLGDDPTMPLPSPAALIVAAHAWEPVPPPPEPVGVHRRTTLGGAAHEFEVPAPTPTTTSSRTWTLGAAMAAIALLTLLVGAVLLRGRRAHPDDTPSPSRALVMPRPTRDAPVTPTPLPAAALDPTHEPAAMPTPAPVAAPTAHAEVTNEETAHPTRAAQHITHRGGRGGDARRRRDDAPAPTELLTVPTRPTTAATPRNCIGPNGTNLCL